METAAATPSAVPSAAATIELPASGTPEYAEWRLNGTLPERIEKPKPAAPAAADAPQEASSEAEPGSETGESKQGTKPRKQSTEERFRLLTEHNKELKRQLEEARRPKPTQADPSPARPSDASLQQPQSYAEWRKDFKPAKWIEKYGADHPGTSYEEGYAAMADWQYEVRRNFEQAEQARSAAMERAAGVRAQASELYADFEEVATPMADKVLALVQDPKVDGTLKRAMLEPEGFHILYALGKDPEIAEKFGKLAIKDPAEAIFLWKSLRAAVREELAKPTPANAVNEAEVEPPARRTPESAAAPPLAIGARGGAPASDSERALSKLADGDPKAFAAWKRAEDAKDLRRRRGA